LSTRERDSAQTVSAPSTLASLGGVPPRRHRRLWLVLGLVACLAGASIIAVATAQSKTTPTTASTASTTSPPSAPPSAARQGTTPAPGTGTAVGTIASSFNTFFDFADGTVSDKLAVVEGGGALGQALTEALSMSFAPAATGAKVDDATMLDDSACTRATLSAPCAQVTYDVLGVGGSVILPGSEGYAVKVDGTWRLAKITVCGLFELFYDASAKAGTPPGC
jgi:hypothetical protein